MMTRPGSPRRPVARPRHRHRLGAGTALALCGTFLLAGPAVADLDEIRDRIEQVERQREQRDGQRSDVGEHIGALEQDRDVTSGALVRADQRLRETTVAVDQAQRALGAAEVELAGAEAEAERIDGELTVAYAAEAKIEDSLEAVAADREETRQAVGAIARESYKTGGLGALEMTLEVIAGEGDLVQEMSMTRTVMRYQDSTIERLGAQQAQEVAEQDRLAGVRRDIALLLAEAEATVLRKEAARSEAQAAQQEVEQRRVEQASAKAALEGELATVEGQLATAQRESEELEAELARLAQEKYGLEVQERTERERIAEEERRRAAEEAARRAAAEEAARRAAAEQAAAEQAAAEQAAAEQAAAQRAAAEQSAVEQAAAEERRQEAAARQAEVAKPSPPSPAAEPPPPAAAPQPGGPLNHPSSSPTSSEFGHRTHPVLGTTRLHAGLDYAGGCGAPVRAPADGTVVMSGSSGGGGKKLVVDHGVLRGVNLTTVYLHLEGFAVTSGQVSRGQVIAYIGNTGTSTGCHLHFETRENGTAVDPRTWL